MEESVGEKLGESESFEDLKEAGVDVQVYEDIIEIKAGSGGYFTAAPDENRILKLWVQTIRHDGQRSPYFEKHRASELARRAINYFDKHGQLRGIAFDWGKPPTTSPEDRSDNYSTYLTKRDELSQTMSIEEARKKAAQATWTYRQVASPNGFNILTRIEEVGDPANPTTVKGIISREPLKIADPAKT